MKRDLHLSRIEPSVLGRLFLLGDRRESPYCFTLMIVLDAPLDRARLDRAWAETVAEFPALGWRFQGGAWRPGEAVAVRSELSALGTRIDPRRSPPVRIYGLSRAILWEVHHGLCDGVAFGRVCLRVLARLFGLPLEPWTPDLSDPFAPLAAARGLPKVGLGRTIPYPFRGWTRAPRWSWTWELDAPPLRELAARWSSSIPDLTTALFAKASSAWVGAPTPLNLSLPVNLRTLCGLRSDGNACGMVELELDVAPDSDLEAVCRAIGAQRAHEYQAERQLGRIAGAARAFANPVLRALPWVAQQALAEAVSRGVSDRKRTAMISWFGSDWIRGALREHVRLVVGYPMVKDYRMCSLGCGETGDRLAVTFHLRAKEPRIVECFRAELERAAPGAVRGAWSLSRAGLRWAGPQARVAP
ncbi:MAG: hypothetical protein KDD82_21690 [Planctomycetes bacterium]|nr:hypothetical protein [Planctomycetota bacterium]